MYIDIFRGEWQEGLKLMFRDRYLYDLGTFNNALYEKERPDLDKGKLPDCAGDGMAKGIL